MAANNERWLISSWLEIVHMRRENICTTNIEQSGSPLRPLVVDWLERRGEARLG